MSLSKHSNKARLVVLIFLAISMVTANAIAQNKIIAIVNNEVITQKDLEDFLNFMRIQFSRNYQGEALESKIQSIKLDLIDRLIEDRLILQEAKKRKINIYPDRIKAKLQEIKGRYGSESEFQASLAKQGLVEADVESRIKEQMLMYAIVQTEIKDKVAVDPAEVTEYYNKNISQFLTPEVREFESVKIENEDKAKEIFEKLKSVKEITALTKEYSFEVNKLTAVKGELRPDIESVVFKLKENEAAEPVKMQGSFYIFKLNRIIPSKQQSLAEAQETTYGLIFNQKMQRELTRWLEGLKKNAYIKVM